VTYAQDQRLAFCAAALAAGPSAPTLCEGWTVADLTAHLYVRENDPVASLGIVVPSAKDLAERRMDEALGRYGFEPLVAVVRNGPGKWSPFRLFDAQANTTEMFVHTEDVRRAADPVPPARVLGRAFEDALWKQLGLAKLTLRKSPVGVVLERSDAAGTTLRAKGGDRTVTIVGLPSELTLFVAGRRQVADVQLIGDPDAVSRLRAFTTSM